MSQPDTRSERNGQGDFRLTRIFHPSHHVTSLDEADDFFARVFGRPSRTLSSLTGGAGSKAGTRMDYSIFTPISDVLFDSIDPAKNIVNGVQIYDSPEQSHLRGFGWYVDGITDAYRALRDGGIRVMNQLGEVVDGDEPPVVGGRFPMFFTVPDDAGQRYQLTVPTPGPLDPREEPGWVLPAVTDEDPLGIERSAYHTVLTENPARALAFVGLLGGRVIGEARNEAIGATSTYVHLADSILEFAVPDLDTAAHKDSLERAPHDTYHSITWRVVDLDRVAGHLERQNVTIRTRTDDTIITEPDTSLGVPWGFTTSFVPGDPRFDAQSS